MEPFKHSPGGSSKQLAACVVASLPVFMTGIVLGWPSPVMDYMLKGRVPVLLTDRQTSVMVACIDVGTFLMAIPAGRLMDWIGRKFTVYLSAPLMFIGWMFILFGRQAWCLYAARLVQGTAVGIAWVVAPAYVGEMASARIRGQLGLLVQLSYATGLLFSYTAGWLLADYTALAVISASVSVVCGVLFALVPESPYYLMLNGRSEEAALKLWSLRSYTNDDEFRNELVAVKNSVLNYSRQNNIKDLLNRDRRPLTIVIVLAMLQMACGASVLEAYASTILADTGMSANASAVALGLIVLAAAVPFAVTVDRCGRRPLMFTSCLGMAACHAGVAVFASAKRGHWLPLFASLAGVQFFINVGVMPLLSIVQCEYFPSDTRALADTAVVLTVTMTSTIMITAYQPVADAFGVGADFTMYAMLSLAGGAFCYVCMPETKCKSFAEIHTDFRRERTAALLCDDDGHGTQERDYEQI